MAMRRTDMKMLMDYCRNHFRQSNWGSEQRIADYLAAEHGWPRQRVASALHKALEDESQSVMAGPGGRILYYGDDRSIYMPAAKGLQRFLHRSPTGLRHILAIKTANVGDHKHDGIWQHPDFLVLADPPRRRSAAAGREVHAIEVESARGFDIKSIYQAYEQGRGADYRWVFSGGKFSPGTARDRIMRAAEDLGVGWVEMARPTASSTWHLCIVAKRHPELTQNEREQMLVRNGIKDPAHWLEERREVGIFTA